MTTIQNNPEEVQIIDKFEFARKSEYIPIKNKDLNIATNFFKFNLSSLASKTYFKYDVTFQPEIPGDALRMRRQVMRKARDQLQAKLGHYLFNMTMLYARENVSDAIELEIELDDQKYLVIVTWVQAVQNDSYEAQSLYKKFFFRMVTNLKFCEVKKTFFDSAAGKKMENFDLDIWKGFKPTIALMENQILLNLNMVCRVINTAFKGLTVVTRYNGDKTYTIDSVDLEKSPNDTFETKDGQITYINYYKTKYASRIKTDIDINQPLLVFQDKKGKIIHLIPQLCYLTGLTDEMRSNFQLMSKMAELTKGSPNLKIEESLDLLRRISEDQACKKECDRWGISIDNKPIFISGKKVNAGNIELGRKVTVDIENVQDLDRQIQKQMFSQPKINDWAVNIFLIKVIYNSKNTKDVEEFINTLGQVKRTFNFEAVELKKIAVNSINFEDWKKAVYNNTSPKTQMLICAIPGSRGKGPLYKDLKKLLVNTLPIPSQFILAGTLSKRIVFFYIAKGSKVGGEPWAVTQLPFTKVPTMICSFDIKADMDLLSFVATYNNTFTKYTPITKVGSNYSKNLSDCMTKSVENVLKSLI
jgi:aubergine-like protein